MLTVDDLIEFETRLADEFNLGKIPHPIHLSDGNESQLIKIFESIADDDWVFCSWRSHYQCLLKGVPQSELLDAIRTGRSIALTFPKYRVYSSAIVGGQLPQALGVASALKRMGKNDNVWCFVGDMTSETGVAQTVFQYAWNWDLPINFIIEDNGKSVMTDTREVWNTTKLRFETTNNPKIKHFKYKSKYPHAGAGTRVQF
jgi:pyruvate dehydrogenase E1 component alpha subunit